MRAVIKWRWWYPEGCIDSGDLHEHETNVLGLDRDGADSAEEIVQKYIDENGTDGVENFEIEIVSPEDLAAVYDVSLEWAPVAYAAKRSLAEA
jgi:hypothetical protein